LSSDAARLRVLLVSTAPGGGQPWRWLRRSGDLDAHLAGWDDAPADGVTYDVVWVDSRSLDLPPGPPRALVNGSTGLLLTRGACRLAPAVGLGPEPMEQLDTIWRDADDDLHLFTSFTEFPRIRGHCPMRRHPLFDGLGNGTYTWSPADGESFVRLTWRWPDWPPNAAVIAVERSCIHVNAERATIWSHPRSDAPAVLCIGAYLPFESRDMTFRRRMERLVRNALHMAAGRSVGEGLTWRRTTPAALEDATLPVGFDSAGAQSGDAAPDGDALLAPFAGPIIAGTPGDDSPFTLAGRRVLIAGGESRGIDEIWMHPLRVLANLRIAGAQAIAVEITPTGVVRTLRVGSATVTERIVAAHDEAAAIVEWSADRAVRLDVSFRSDLRLMWPYPGWCLSPLRWHRAGALLTIRGSGGDDAATLIWNRTPDHWDVVDASTSENPVFSSRAVIAIDGPSSAVRLGITVVVDGERVRPVVPAVNGGAPHRDVPSVSASRIVETRNAAIRLLLDDRLAIDCSEAGVADAVKWAVYRLDSTIVRTPSLGTGLIAGYWTSSEGWGDGRPGYAWYFGRDAVWTALGSLAVGDFAAAALTLRFLGRHQDLSGKILHECTTSGLVHYDASDSTTLYLLLAARYLAWTGDEALIREEWPRIRRAFDFALGTDRDGDGLVENTRIGHGWIEFGRLGGGDVTHYNASIWTAALNELTDIARLAGEPEFATRLVALAIRARRALERTFFDEATGRYALNVRRDEAGGWTGNWTQTAMQAVPLLLGMVEPARMRRWLDDVPGDAFTSPWGVRMVPNTDPHYDPKSYHGGAVWPLYTGWVSWAEFAAGHSRDATRHWRMNAGLALERAKGAWDEVLHGEEHRAAGVCPDQAWSTAMAVAPFVYGMLGVAPDALRRRLRLAPQIPEEWRRLRVERIRVGDVRVALDYSRDDGVHRFRLSGSGGSYGVAFEPAVPSPVCAVRVNGQPVPAAAEPFGERHRVRLALSLHEPVTVEIVT
jgi:hypothetical protein